MRKIESSRVFLAEHLNLFQCPVCGEGFQEVSGNSIICRKQHQFDLSKKGTLHLLQKGGQNEYGKEMLNSRKKLAQSGFFHPILDVVKKQMRDIEPAAVLDVGCGEGSHLHVLTEKGLSGVKIGFDISKDAIQLAAGEYFEDAFWCVADLAHSPFSAGQFDLILNIFSPSHYQEFHRLLKPTGKVIKVVPDPEYLIELREKLYVSDATKRVYENEKVVNRFKEHYPTCLQEQVRYTVPLTPDTSRWLLEMTPLTWGAADQTIAEVMKEPLKQVTVAVTVLTGSREQE